MSGGSVIVTGATGLVGRAVAERLNRDGASVVAVGRSPAETAAYEFVDLDLERRSLDELADRRPEAIVHCAAHVPGPPDRPDDHERADATRNIDAGVFAASARLRCRVVYVSSCILYDPLDPVVKTEVSDVRAATPYAEAKLAGEMEAATLDGSLVMRIPSPVGARMRPTTVLPRFVTRASRGQTLEIWGSGMREQDFIHVRDLAAFVVLALATDVRGTFNVASGRPVSMRVLADSAVRVVGRGAVRQGTQADPLDGATARYDIARARGELGWEPRVDLDEMIRELSSAAGLL
jgi:nucleoside-diphosphate-sugar epimerase